MNPQEPERRIWTVSALNRMVRDLLEGSLYPIWLTGQVGNLTLHASGHVYLTIKDASAQVRAVFFNGAAKCRAFRLREGDQIEVFGSVSVFEARGEYQLSIRSVQRCGVGDLQQRFDALKQRLAAEGLFESARKKTIPYLPTRIGVISSASGAALRDFLKIALARFPNLHIRVCPAPVQGRGAENKLAGAIRFFNRIGNLDVIVLTRGGGSLEDLWPFNEEVLARAIAQSRIPVVSAIGHEIDFTIADFAADLRAPTPSGAAEMLFPEARTMRDTVTSLNRRAVTLLQYRREQCEAALLRILHARPLRDVTGLLHSRMQQLDLLLRDAAGAMTTAFRDASIRLDHLNSSLDACDPDRVLKRGYVMLTRSDGVPVISARRIHPGERLTARLADGCVPLDVPADFSSFPEKNH